MNTVSHTPATSLEIYKLENGNKIPIQHKGFPDLADNYIECEVSNPDGSDKQVNKIPMRSMLPNFAYVLGSIIGNNMTYKSSTYPKTTTNVLASTYENYFLSNNHGSANLGTQGILVGTSNAAVSTAEYNLTNIPIQGSGSSQLGYGETTYTITADIAEVVLTAQRTFTNNSGGDIALAETGIIFYDAQHSFRLLMTRDLLTLPGGVLPSNKVLTIRYIFNTTTSSYYNHHWLLLIYALLFNRSLTFPPAGSTIYSNCWDRVYASNRSLFNGTIIPMIGVAVGDRNGLLVGTGTGEPKANYYAFTEIEHGNTAGLLYRAVENFIGTAVDGNNFITTTNRVFTNNTANSISISEVTAGNYYNCYGVLPTGWAYMARRYYETPVIVDAGASILVEAKHRITLE